jgi:hypothetical protein
LVYEGIGEELDGISDSKSECDTVERGDVSKQKETLLSMIFKHHSMDVDQLMAYLEDFFAPKETAKALANVRNSVHGFGFSFQRSLLVGLTVKRIIRGLSASSMNEEQREPLTEFQKNERVLHAPYEPGIVVVT